MEVKAGRGPTDTSVVGYENQAGSIHRPKERHASGTTPGVVARSRLSLTLVALALALFLPAQSLAHDAPGEHGGAEAAPAKAESTVPDPANAGSTVPEHIVFPVVGKSWYMDDFGAPRPQGLHEGNDIMARRMAPVVATENGHITIWTASERAGCMLYLYGESGTTYVYVHLNNDLTKHDDNEGGCVEGVAYAPGLTDGQTVKAGQLLGYVGDSGDAEDTDPHLHFEIIPDDREPVSPYVWLERAYYPLFAYRAPADPPVPVSLRLQGRVVSTQTSETGTTVTLDARVVRIDSRRKIRIRRQVTVAVAPEAIIRRKAKARRKPASLAKVTAGRRIVLWTAAADPTTAQIASDGTLTATRLLIRR